MSLTTSLAVFFIVWWTVLFAVLPWGIRSQVEAGDVVPGTDPGAPAVPRLGHKMLWTTLVAAITFAAIDIVYSYRLVELEDLAALFGFSR
jgi:predicted secreted protein